MAFESFIVEEIATQADTIHSLRRGAGPPLLLLHGYPQTHFIWQKIADRLSEHYTVVLTEKPVVHAHAVIGKDGIAHGGHLLEAHIRPTCEVIPVCQKQSDS